MQQACTHTVLARQRIQLEGHHSPPVQVESARKLRWYDREDLRPLVESNIRDKQLLQDTIAALRQVLCPPNPGQRA